MIRNGFDILDDISELNSGAVLKATDDVSFGSGSSTPSEFYEKLMRDPWNKQLFIITIRYVRKRLTIAELCNLFRDISERHFSECTDVQCVYGFQDGLNKWTLKDLLLSSSEEWVFTDDDIFFAAEPEITFKIAVKRRLGLEPERKIKSLLDFLTDIYSVCSAVSLPSAVFPAGINSYKADSEIGNRRAHTVSAFELFAHKYRRDTSLNEPPQIYIHGIAEEMVGYFFFDMIGNDWICQLVEKWWNRYAITPIERIYGFEEIKKYVSNHRFFKKMAMNSN